MEKQRGASKPTPREAPEVSEAMAEAIRIAGSPTRCPYCHEDCAREEARVCAGCLARHHGACWDELGRCGSCQGERSLAEGEQPPTPEGSCRACGSHKSAAVTCVGCERDVCRPCFRRRFRRCVDCSAGWLKSEKRLKKLKERDENAQAVIFFAGLLAVGGAVCTLVFPLALDTVMAKLIGVGIAAPLTVFFAWGLRLSLRQHRELAAEIDVLEEELAPFEEGLAAKVIEGARKFISSTTRSLRGQE